jgi:hypothetical protein
MQMKGNDWLNTMILYRGSFCKGLGNVNLVKWVYLVLQGLVVAVIVADIIIIIA